ncbi:MAG TPA: DUF2911 domain-containing protein [Candidatus Dormibacteraeota bacterium]|nr:DUF2911 domain-containing protein [Candidatus Dormibacteraeota bacterium]
MRKHVVGICTVLFLSLAAFTIASHAQQDKSKRPSPPAKADCKLPDGKTITVNYSSPRAKGRKIYGGLVPYGEVWRAGANEATTFVTTAALTVGEKDVPAGSYTIFVVPNEDKWTLIISKKTGEWGIPYPGEAEDVARVDMKVSSLPSPVENFTISFAQDGSECKLQLDWEKTRASVEVSEKK